MTKRASAVHMKVFPVYLQFHPLYTFDSWNEAWRNQFLEIFPSLSPNMPIKLLFFPARASPLLLPLSLSQKPVCVYVCVRANIRHRWRSITAPGASVPWGPGPCFCSQDPKQNRPLSCNQVHGGSDYYPIRAQHERVHTGLLFLQSLSHIHSKSIPKYRK